MSYTNKESLKEIKYQIDKLSTLIRPFIESDGSPYEKGKSYIVFFGCHEMLSSFVNQAESGRIYVDAENDKFHGKNNKKNFYELYIPVLKDLKEIIQEMFSDTGCPYEMGKANTEIFFEPLNVLESISSMIKNKDIIQSDFAFSQEELREHGFQGFETIEKLMKDSSKLPNYSGVYILLNKNSIDRNMDYEPAYSSFIFPGTGGFFKDKDPNVEISVLQRKMHPDSNVMYIGKASDLKRRIKQYLAFGQGKNVGHYGGRYIWQLKQSSKLILAYKKVSENPLPEEYERALINMHKVRFNKLPFANLR
tara:strand:+ start:4060 stop:4980 length:921 start_codon:yes stop_codon:yes gene_type:complete